MAFWERALIILLGVCLFFPSCKSFKELSAGRIKKIQPDSLFSALEKSRLQYEWFSAKARVNYKDKSISKSFTAAIRMRRDSVIWISVTTTLGVEAARLLMRNDSVFFIDRLNKIYKHEPLSCLEQFVPFPFTIGILQNILIGNPMLEVSENTKVKQEKESYTLSSASDKYKYAVTFDAANLRISTEYLTDIQSNRSISLVFADYLSEADRLFSYARVISVKADESSELSLKFSKVKWDEPLTFPFQVGDKYEEE